MTSPPLEIPPELSGLQAYLESLDTAEKTAALSRLALMSPADLRSLGASEAQYTEHDDDVVAIDEHELEPSPALFVVDQFALDDVFLVVVYDDVSNL